jgi:CheY-like chemotaxis protein
MPNNEIIPPEKAILMGVGSVATEMPLAPSPRIGLSLTGIIVSALPEAGQPPIALIYSRGYEDINPEELLKRRPMVSESPAPAAASILLVDDSDEIRGMVARILEQEGYEVGQAANAREAVSLIDHLRPDLVITDIFMPEGDGFELMREIRDRNPRLPVIVMSGGAQIPGLNFLDVADRFGAAVILSKPFRRGQLLDAVNRALVGKEP